MDVPARDLIVARYHICDRRHVGEQRWGRRIQNMRSTEGRVAVDAGGLEAREHGAYKDRLLSEREGLWTGRGQ